MGGPLSPPLLGRLTALVFLVVPFRHPSLLCSLSTSIHPGPQDHSRPHSFVRYSSSSSPPLPPITCTSSHSRWLRVVLDYSDIFLTCSSATKGPLPQDLSRTIQR